MKDDTAEVLSIEGRDVHVTHPDKPYFSKQASAGSDQRNALIPNISLQNRHRLRASPQVFCVETHAPRDSDAVSQP